MISNTVKSSAQFIFHSVLEKIRFRIFIEGNFVFRLVTNGK